VQDISKLEIKLVATKKSEYSIPERELDAPLQPRFDPATGHPLFKPSSTYPKKDLQKQAPPRFRKTEKFSSILKEDSDLSQKRISMPGDVAKKVFTVLEPEVREKFINLSVTDEERDLISKALIYLESNQQLRYMDEIHNVNLDPEILFEQYIKRIHVLPIEPQQRRFLVEQLEYLPHEKQEEFVSFLEQTVK